MFWRRDKRPDILSGQGQAASAEIEMTSYALLAILSHDVNAPISKVMPIVRWLTSNRNAFGGFVSTQVSSAVGTMNYKNNNFVNWELPN